VPDLTDGMSLAPSTYYDRALTHQDTARSYTLLVPPAIASPVRVVVALHGGGSTPAVLVYDSMLNATANTYGFLVLYPQALTYWETVAPGIVTRDVNDVSFIQACVEDLEQFTTVDKLYCCGLSNGSHMTLKAAAGYERILAMACVAGIRKPCQYCGTFGRSVPLMIFQGMEDTFQPHLGGVVDSGTYFQAYTVPNAERAAYAWARHNHCGTPTITTLGAGKHISWPATAPGSAPVEFYLLDDGGHTWPGGRATQFEIDGGVGDNSATAANPLIKDFFWQF
jgi:polyhydroxybutyrate depolymerase